MTVRRALFLCVAIGVIGGVIAAVAIPRTRAAGRAAQALGPPGVLRTAPAIRHPGNQGYVDLRLRGASRIEARARDPRGGPDWAVRVFRADRVLPPDLRRHGVNPVIGRDLCAQLGRIYRGRFGWLDATGTFRPVAIDLIGSPTTCGSKLPDLRGEPFFDVVIPITNPAKPEAHPKQVVVWGLAGSAATGIRLRLGASTVAAPRTPHGAFVAFGPPELRSQDVSGTITYPRGRTVELPRHITRPYPGSVGRMVLSGRAPDPNGGLPYALLSNDTCTQWGTRILDDDRFGSVDYRLGTFRERAVGGAACGRSASDDAKAFRRYPVLLGYGSGEDDLDLASPVPGRVARRTQRGITIVTGRVAPDVVAVTLETPRDVRTLVPGGPAHAIIAVYDGTFPTGAIRITARYKDGHSRTQSYGSFGF